MAGQGEMLITMDVPESTARGLFVDGAGALSATNKAVGCLVEGTDAGELKASVQVAGTAFGVLAEAAGISSLNLENVNSLEALDKILIERYPVFEKYNYRVSVNRVLVSKNMKLKDGDEVALMPPFANNHC